MLQHSEQKKTEDLKRIVEVIENGESPLSEEEVSCLMECSVILFEDANIRVMNLSKPYNSSGFGWEWAMCGGSTQTWDWAGQTVLSEQATIAQVSHSYIPIPDFLTPYADLTTYCLYRPN
jgi:hypothetical protein